MNMMISYQELVRTFPRMGARNANKNITMENEFIFKSFYYINLKLLYFLYKQLLQYQKMHIQSYSLYL